MLTSSSPGVPVYRTKVLYVPQRPSLLPGTPQDFLQTILAYAAHRKPSGQTSEKPAVWERALQVSKRWGIDSALWRREWATLSGGEAQRMGLAVAVSLGDAEVILLDGQSGICAI